MSKVVCIAIRHPTEPSLFLHGLRRDNRKWTLAGGHAIPGETSHESANRELAEETGLKNIKLDKVHAKEYDTNHVTLFTGLAPDGHEFSSEQDPDREFVTFKYLDPTKHNNMHIPKSKNILVEWMKSTNKILHKFEKNEKIKSINWTQPSVNQIKQHLASEDEHEAMEFAHAGTVHTFQPHEIAHITRGAGTTPPAEWLMNPNVVPKEYHNDPEKYRYYHGHHAPGGLIDRIKSGSNVDMPIIGKYGNSYMALGGRHRIAYSQTLGIPLQAIVLNIPIVKKSDLNKAQGKFTVEPFTADPANFNPKKHDFIVRVHHRGKPIGFVAMAHQPGGLMPFNFHVDAQHRRKGHGTNLMAYAQKLTGKKVLTSPDRTQDSQAFWNSNPLKKNEPVETVLGYPVSVGNKKAHMAIKHFGPTDEVTQQSIQTALDQVPLNAPLNEQKMMFMPYRLPKIDGSYNYQLMAHGVPANVTQARDMFKESHPDKGNFRLSIPIDKEDWEHYSKMGEFLKASDIGLKFHPLELRAGPTVLKTY